MEAMKILLKPGFNRMYKEFKDFVINNCEPTTNSASIEDAKKTLSSCWDLIGNDFDLEF